MTRQEAIFQLQEMVTFAEDLNINTKCVEALEKAIKVLSETHDELFEYLTFEIKS